MRSACLVGSLLVAAGCGEGTGSRGAPTESLTIGEAQQVILSGFNVRPLTGVYANRTAKLRITVRTSHPQLMLGAFSRLRRLGPIPTVVGQTRIGPSNLRPPNQLIVDVTAKLPAGRSSLGFSVVGTEITSNEIVFTVTARSAPSPATQPAPSDADPGSSTPSSPPPPSPCWAGCHPSEPPVGGRPPPHPI